MSNFLSRLQQIFYRRRWWIIASFAAPFLFALVCGEAEWLNRFLIALRTGLVSAILALTIFALAKLDDKIGNSDYRKKDAQAAFLARLMAIMLWLVWFGTSQIVLTAADETQIPREMSDFGK